MDIGLHPKTHGKLKLTLVRGNIRQPTLMTWVKQEVRVDVCWVSSETNHTPPCINYEKKKQETHRCNHLKWLNNSDTSVWMKYSWKYKGQHCDSGFRVKVRVSSVEVFYFGFLLFFSPLSSGSHCLLHLADPQVIMAAFSTHTESGFFTSGHARKVSIPGFFQQLP